MKILADLFFMWRKEKLEVQLQQKEIAEQRERISQENSPKRIKRSAETYNLTQVAQALGVHRQTLYYWIKKGWVKPRRDYRNYPVFTLLDIQGLKQWLNSIRPGDF
jgi:DNA-binding XRE family transcriptional regulator